MRVTNGFEKTRFSLPAHYIPRCDLERKVREGLRKRLLLVVAAAGYGKSTAVAHAVAELQEPVLWYTFDHSDFSVALLTRILAERLGEICGCSFSFPLAPDASALDCAQFLARCVERAAPEGAHLVFDDFDQSPAQGPVASFVQYLLDLGPRHVRIVITSTVRPDLDLSSVASAGQLARVGKEHLTYCQSEVAQLLCSTWGESVADSLLSRVYRMTGGWPAGLSLFLMAYPTRPSSSELPLPSATTVSERGTGIIEHLTGPDRELLCAMALSPVIELDDLEELTGIPDSKARARDLIDRSPVFRSAGAGSYVMSPAVREQLVAAAERDWGPDKVAMSRRRVAANLERNGRLEHALSLFLDLRDVGGVNRVLGALGVGVLQDWDPARVIAVVAKLEGLANLGAEGSLLCARASGARGNMQACDRYCTDALNKVDRAAAPRLFLSLSAIQANARSFPDTAGSAEELWSGVREQLPSAGPDRGWFRLWFASFLIRTGRLKQGEKELRQALSALRQDGAAAQVGWAMNRLADLQIKRGRYRAALTTLRRASPTSRRAGTFQAMVNRYLFAQVNRFQGKITEAQDHLNHALELAALADASWAKFSFQLLLMELALWRGDSVLAQHLYEEAEGAVSTASSGTRGQHSLRAAKGRLAAALGAENEAFEAFSEAVELEAESEYERAWNTLHACLFFVRTGRNATASQVLKRVIGAALRMEASHLWTNALLIRSHLSQRQGDSVRASKDLKQFWSRARRGGYRFMPASDEHLISWATGSSGAGGAPSERSGRPFLKGFPRATKTGDLHTRPPVREDLRPIQVRTLGPLRVDVRGAAVGEGAWRSNLKGKRLMELLLSSRSFRVSADEAVEMLWPAAPADKGRHRLHTAVTRLRAALDELGIQDQVHVEYEHSFYRLVVSDEVETDHTTFQSLAERGLAEARKGRHRCAQELLTKAVGMYAGVFLEDALYERFTEFRREQLAELVGRAYRALAASPVVSQQEALAWWERALEHDPYDESAYQGAIECCVTLGMHGRAQAHYASMQRHLVEELGVVVPEWAEKMVGLLGHTASPPP